MSEPDLPEIIRHFRSLLAKRHSGLAWSALGGGLLCVGLKVAFHDHFFLNAFFGEMILLGVLTWVHILLQRRELLALLEKDDQASLTSLQQHLENSLHRWQSHNMTRFMAGGLLVAIALMCLFLFKNWPLTPWFASLFILYILGCMVKGWLVFSDSILLQDVSRIR